MRNFKIKPEVPVLQLVHSSVTEKTIENLKNEIDLLRMNIPWYKRGATDIKEGIRLYKKRVIDFKWQIDEKRNAIVNMEADIKNIRRTVDEFRSIRATLMELMKCLDEMETDMKTDVLIFFYSDFFE